MPETIQNFIQQLRQAGQISPQHRELLEAIEDLERASAPFRRFRRRSKLPLVKAADRERLMALHHQIGLKAEALLAGNDGQELKSIVRKLSNLAAQNYRALLGYDPKQPKTLDSLEAEARTLVVHVGEGEIKNQKWGKNLSQRTPLAIYDSNGKKISGLFTEKTELRISEEFDHFLDQFIEDSPNVEEEESLRQILQVVRQRTSDPEFLRSNMPPKPNPPYSEDRADNITALLRNVGSIEVEGERRMDHIELMVTIRKLLPQEMKERFTEAMAERMAEPLTKLRRRFAIHHVDAQIPEGARLDTRNAAMSTVADLLGLPNLLARARPMKLVKPDGTVIEGTFMAAAKGLDSGNLPARALRINEESLIQTNGNGFRDIGDLQVLDFLCGNVDRHPGNLSYQFDPYDSFIGTQGFDNDCAMGALAPKDGKGKNRLVGTRHLMAVSQRTYARIMQLQPAVLKYALRGYGLSEAELEAAGQRLTTLQTDLKREKDFYREYDRTHRGKPLLTDHVRILKDNQWMDYDAEDFYVSEDPKDPEKSVVTENLFLSATNQVKRLGAKYQNQQKAFENLNRLVAVGSKNRAVPSTALREFDLADRVSRTLSKRSWWGFSSDNYDRLQTAVENYRKAQKRLNERLKSAGSEDARRRADYHRERDAVVTQEDLERMAQLSQAMRDAAQTYLTGKRTDHGQLPANASEYTRNRVEAAEMVLRFANERVQVRSEERGMAQENEARAAGEAQRRRQALQPEPAPAAPRVLNS